MPDVLKVLKNLSVRSCKLSFVYDTFSLRWIDAMHVDYLSVSLQPKP